jgi:hypothetical protein
MKALDWIKLTVGAAAAALGTLAAADGLPMSWHKGVMIGLSVATALSQFIQKIGTAPADKPEQK